MPLVCVVHVHMCVCVLCKSCIVCMRSETKTKQSNLGRQNTERSWLQISTTHRHTHNYRHAHTGQLQNHASPPLCSTCFSLSPPFLCSSSKSLLLSLFFIMFFSLFIRPRFNNCVSAFTSASRRFLGALLTLLYWGKWNKKPNRFEFWCAAEHFLYSKWFYPHV